MSFKELSPETLAALEETATAFGATSMHVIGVRVCDRCHRENEEAFPYGHLEYRHLCNDCADEVCDFGEPPGEIEIVAICECNDGYSEPDKDCPDCGGLGFITRPPDAE